MLWSIGKDSTVLLWLARKAFFGHVPMPLVHIDTSYKIPEMIQYRDRLAAEWRLTVIYGQNEEALAAKQTFPDGNVDRLTCCGNLKTEALRRTLSGEGKRYRFDHKLGKYVVDTNTEPYTGVIVGARADEEGSRSKERYFSPRSGENNWNIADQPPEFWNQYATEFAPGTHVRIHPLLDWTELDIWEYIERERIPTVSLYYDQGKGERYRSLGCWPCTKSVTSDAKNVPEIIVELKSGRFANIAERSGRAQDKDDGGASSRSAARATCDRDALVIRSAMSNTTHHTTMTVAPGTLPGGSARRGFTLWLTGLSGSGKSTLASALAARSRGRRPRGGARRRRGARAPVEGLTFSREDRDLNVRRIAYVAKLLCRNGVAVITAAISPTARRARKRGARSATRSSRCT